MYDRTYFGGCSGALKENENEVTPDFVPDLCRKSGRGLSYLSGGLQICRTCKGTDWGKIEILVKCREEVWETEKSVIEQMQFSGIDFARVSMSTLAEDIPKLNVLQMPYLYTDTDHNVESFRRPYW